MLSSSEKQLILKAYREKNKEIRKRWGRILLRISLFMLLALAILIILIGWQDNIELQVFSFIFGGIAILISLVSYLVSRYMYSPKATYQVLIPALLEKLNFYEERSVDYQAYNKDYKTINKESQLFSRGASVSVYGSLNGFNNSMEAWAMHDIRVVISTGQSTAILFDGFLFELNRKNKVAFQLRSASRPSNKPIKFRKEEKVNGYKLFVEEGENIPSNVHNIAKRLEEIASMFHVKHLYFSALKDKTYLGIQSKSLPRKQGKLTEEKVEELYQEFARYINIMNMLGDVYYDFDH